MSNQDLVYWTWFKFYWSYAKRGKDDRTSQKFIFLGKSHNSKTALIGVKDEKGAFKVRKPRKITFIEQKLLNYKSFSA